MARSTFFFFAAFFVVAVVGFWPSHFARITQEGEWRVHFHGVMMFGRCALLATLACLAVWDWPTGHRVFPRLLGVFVLIQLPTFFMYQAGWCPEVAAWVVRPSP